MSARALNWAWAQMRRCPGCRAKLTLVALADRADDEGRAWPHVKTLAAKLDTSEDTVGRSIADLEKAGLVERERRRRDDGSYAGWEYRLPLESHPAPLRDGSPEDHTAPVRDGDPSPDRSPAVDQTATVRSQETTIGDVKPPPGGADALPGSANAMVAHFVDLAKAKGAKPPRSVSARVGREAKRLLDEGFTEEQVKAGLALMVEKGLSPAVLPSLVFQAQTAGAVKQVVSPERKLSPFARAQQFILGSGWQHADDVLAEILGRDFGIEGDAKQRLMETARNVRASREAKAA